MWPFSNRRLDSIDARLDALFHLIRIRGVKMDKDIQRLVDEVAEVKGKVSSTAAFITGLEQRITDILSSENLKPETTEALQAAFADLKGSSQALSDAIDNDPNTPAPVEPAP